MQSRKAQIQEVGGHAVRIKNNMLINNPQSQISPNEVLQSWLINTVYHLLVKNNKGEERGGGLKREEGLINFLCLKSSGGGGAYLREGL